VHRAKDGEEAIGELMGQRLGKDEEGSGEADGLLACEGEEEDELLSRATRQRKRSGSVEMMVSSRQSSSRDMERARRR